MRSEREEKRKGSRWGDGPPRSYFGQGRSWCRLSEALLFLDAHHVGLIIMNLLRLNGDRIRIKSLARILTRSVYRKGETDKFHPINLRR